MGAGWRTDEVISTFGCCCSISCCTTCLCLSNRLFEAHRGQSPVAHVPCWANIMAVSPGPAGSLLLKEGHNKDGDVAKLYFPEEGVFCHIEPELFDDREYDFIRWCQAVDRFVVSDKSQLLAVPTERVLALPRHLAEGKEAG